MKLLSAWPTKPSGGFCVRAVAILAFSVCSFMTNVCASAQSNALTLPRNLAELVDESQTVMQGWVTDVTLEPHEKLNNLMTVVVTLRVEETLKGETAKSYSFSQAVIDKRDLQQRMGYRVGQHLLLILIKPSSYGLSSPAGMEQGRFRIESGGDGKLLATNGYGNAGVFRGLDSQLQSRRVRISPEVQVMITKPAVGPISLEQLKNLIRTIAGASPRR
jgi:hypothetical protein